MSWDGLIAKPQTTKKRDQPAEHENPNGKRVKEYNHDHRVSKQFTNDSQGLAIKRLWSAVISQAIRDACKKPLTMTKSKRNCLKKVMGVPVQENYSAPRATVCGALLFLFEPQRSDHIFEILDIEPEHFRENLLECMNGSKFSGKTAFTEMIPEINQRSFRFNYRWFRNNQEAIGKHYETHKKEEETE